MPQEIHPMVLILVLQVMVVEEDQKAMVLLSQDINQRICTAGWDQVVAVEVCADQIQINLFTQMLHMEINLVEWVVLVLLQLVMKFQIHLEQQQQLVV